ncbi:MAG TPA: dephospho-CoA kinase [Candidatus Enterocola sp.]|nr:dephospho-CoA kinase [Candidatus Enterocola sp.]
MIIGVTGGIGSGKTHFCHLMEIAGFPVFYSDTESKKLLNSDPSIKAQIIDLFGASAYSEGVLDSKHIAQQVFSNKKLRTKLNNIVHPAVKKIFDLWLIEHESSPIILLESAILFESGFDAFVDKIIVIAAPIETRIKRVVQRDKCEEKDVLSRMKSQMSDEIKISKANFVIQNGEHDDLNKQIFDLLGKLMSPK